MPSIHNLEQVVLPTEQDVALAREATLRLASCPRTDGVIRLHVSSSDQSIEVPASAFRMLLDALSYMANGDAVGLVTIPVELTIQQAADFLNVSRPHLDSLLQAKAVQFHLQGTHKRIYFRDLILYKAQLEMESVAALEALATQAQELGFGY